MSVRAPNTGMVIVWEITGPGRDYDYTWVKADTDEGHKKALRVAKDWIEEVWDGLTDEQINDAADAVTIRLREISQIDYEEANYYD